MARKNRERTAADLRELLLGTPLRLPARALYSAQAKLRRALIERQGSHRGLAMPEESEREQVCREVTALLRSFQCQDQARACFDSLQELYPGIRVVIADDSREPLMISHPACRVVQLPWNSGVGLAVERALEQVKTPYVLRLEADMLLCRQSRLGRELRLLHRRPDLDLVALPVRDVMDGRRQAQLAKSVYQQRLPETAAHPKLTHMTRVDGEHAVVSVGTPAYLAATEALRRLGQDEQLRATDWEDLYLRAAGELNTALAMDVFVLRRRDPFDRDYLRWRREALAADSRHLKKKHGFITF